MFNKEISLQSQYIYDVVKTCGSKEVRNHHIKDQQFADKHKMTGHHHKNVKYNLVPLCSKCHLQVTNHQIVVKGRKETFEARIRMVSVESVENSRRIFNEDADKMHL